MSNRSPHIPKYRHYKPKDLAVVRIDGKDEYLGRYDSPESWERYHRRIAEWLAGHGTPQPEEKERDLTVVEVMARYMRFARKYYRKDGRPTSELDEVHRTVRLLCKLYGRTPVHEFGPKRLKVVRQAMVDSGVLSRGVVNHRIARLKRAFKWAVAEELVPASVFQALAALEGLRRGRTTAPDRPPVRPIANDVVEERRLRNRWNELKSEIKF